ncbi:MAG: aldehyde dehydrogenase family protein [bacterium]
MESKKINTLLNKQKDFFNTGKTRDLSFRLDILKKLYDIIEVHESEIMTALYKDLKKGETESYTSEIAYVQKEIKYIIKSLKKWNKPEKFSVPLINQPGKSYIQYDPYGIVLIISPWNYPFGLLFTPLVGAVAAGNCVVAKPSEQSEHTSRLIVSLIRQNFPEEYITVVEGDAEVTQNLIQENIDYIFFTGSTGVGKLIMKSAAEYLIPITLELGGKNPCIVDYEINMDVAVKRIVWGKFFNAGQTCIAPDYLLVHQEIKNEFLDRLIAMIHNFYGSNIKENQDYSHIININHFNRLSDLIKEGSIVTGGEKNIDSLFISPTVITDISDGAKIMQEEIFGPILPVLFYENLESVIIKLKGKPKPLVLYFFSKNKNKQKVVLTQTSSGSVCINGTIHSIMSHKLPFGGLGQSGMGKYHGKASFTTMSHKKSVLKKSFYGDIKAVYPPYKTPIKLLKKVIKFMY